MTDVTTAELATAARRAGSRPPRRAAARRVLGRARGALRPALGRSLARATSTSGPARAARRGVRAGSSGAAGGRRGDRVLPLGQRSALAVEILAAAGTRRGTTRARGTSGRATRPAGGDGAEGDAPRVWLRHAPLVVRGQSARSPSQTRLVQAQPRRLFEERARRARGRAVPRRAGRLGLGPSSAIGFGSSPRPRRTSARPSRA